MIDAPDLYLPLRVVDAVDDAVAAAAGGMLSGEFEMQWSPYAVRVVSQPAVDELSDYGDDSLRQSLQVALPCR